MTILLNYGKREMNPGCDWQSFLMANKLKQRFFHKSPATVMRGFFIAGGKPVL